MMKELYRSNINRKIAGVCGGIGEYLSISPDVIRILFVIGSFIVGLRYGFIVYVVSMLLMPQTPDGYYNPEYNNNNMFSLNSIKNKNLIGTALIVLGILLTLKKVLLVDDLVVISIIFIALGIYIIVKGGQK